jgi:hypothetical protein
VNEPNITRAKSRRFCNNNSGTGFVVRSTNTRRLLVLESLSG